ncbi:zinc finger protein 135-like, partial [Poeciliopsis prolifica]|uniref:zinc finger protein 135-like n=1 Tax=Poeciliopsis prolifica TaxID=188132 RepID=UPI0024145DFA
PTQTQTAPLLLAVRPGVRRPGPFGRPRCHPLRLQAAQLLCLREALHQEGERVGAPARPHWEKPYSCPDCGVSYAQRGCLRRHLLIHSPEKPFSCSLCGRGFVQRRYLVQHERTHTGEKPFSCSLCPKRFASRSGLSDHLKTHQEQKQHSCSLCGKSFSSASSFRDHVRNHTGRKLHPLLTVWEELQPAESPEETPAETPAETCRWNPGEGRSCPPLLPLSGAFLLRQRGEGSRAAVPRRDPVLLRRLQPLVHSLVPAERPPALPHGGAAVPVRRLQDALHCAESAEEAPGDPQPAEPPARHRTVWRSGSARTDPRQASGQNQRALQVESRSNESLPSLTGEKITTLASGSVWVQKTDPCQDRAREEPGGPGSLRKPATGTAGPRDPDHLQESGGEEEEKPQLLHLLQELPEALPATGTHEVHIREGRLPDPADKVFWLHMRTGGQKKKTVMMMRKEDEGVEEECRPGDLSTSDPVLVPGAGQPAGNHGDQGGNQREEEDVSGLINSDGEEERWEPERRGPKISSDPAADGRSTGKSKSCCPVCGRDCFKASALQKHLRIHSGERPFQCPTCRKSFVQHVHMTEHQRIHTGEKPFTCAVCSKSFTFSSALRRHQRVHTDTRPFRCALCPKTFKQLCVLKNHQLTHSGVRYQCPLCSKSFSRALELTYHIDVHSDAQPYYCSVCKKNLSGARIFRKHMRKHESDKPKLDPAAAQSTKTQ